MGVWYQVQLEPDSTDETSKEIPSCEFYTLTSGDGHDQIIMNTTFEIYPEFIDGEPLKVETVSTKYLTAWDDADPAKMDFAPPLGIIRIKNLLY